MRNSIDRRAVLAQLALTCSALALGAANAYAAETTQYSYDSLGRVVRVQFQDGSTVVYSYDSAGNRTIVARTSSPPSSTFTATIAITGVGPINLRTLANAAGYNGVQDANITYTLGSGVTIIGAGGSQGDAGGPGIDSGDWPITQVYVALALQISGTVYGGGGSGAEGNSGVGAQGGDAIFCRAPMAISVNAGGIVKSAGGGGGGGLLSGAPLFRFGGGGGGGGAPNGGGGEGGEGANVNGHVGLPGTLTGGGAGGAAGGAGATAGGAGGSYAATGSAGVSGGGLGGAPGYAVRKNGFTVTVTNNGTIAGTVG